MRPPSGWDDSSGDLLSSAVRRWEFLSGIIRCAVKSAVSAIPVHDSHQRGQLTLNLGYRAGLFLSNKEIAALAR